MKFNLKKNLVEKYLGTPETPDSHPLHMLFNRSLATCIFPDRWKFSFVTNIFKSGRRNDISNYRDIAILSAIAKLFELLVYEDLRGRAGSRSVNIVL
jgi:hypothetical protein